MVLFVGGKCSRNCWYCSLSKNRKNSETTYANERPIKSKKELIAEATESNAKGAGITGGDPLLYFRKTIKYAKALKEKFGEDFHIHSYLPLNLVNEKKLKSLHKFIDEVRFHPSFLVDDSKNDGEIEKIKFASKIFGKENTGIELPMIPEKKKEIYYFIKRLGGKIGFANLNEFEISETNFDIITKNYSLNEDTYTIRNSISAGKGIIRKAANEKLKVKIHLCSARTKDCHQYVNRLKRYKVLPFGRRTDDGNVIYFAVYPKNIRKVSKQIKKITPDYFVDKSKKRIIVRIKDLEKLHRETGLKIARVLEPPTYNSDYLEFSYIDE